MIFNDFVRRHGWAKVALLVLDWLAITLAVAVTFFLHYYAGFDAYDTAHSLDEYLLRVALLYASFPVLVLIFRQHLLYKMKVYTTSVAQLAQLARALLINSLLLIAVFFFVREDLIVHSRTNLLLFSASSLVLLAFFRIVLFRKFILPAVTGFEVRRILLVGAGDQARTLLSEPGGKLSPYEIVAVVDRSGTIESVPQGIVLFQKMPLLQEFVPAYNIHEIVVAENDLPYEDVVRLIAEARDVNVPVHLLSDHFRVVHERVTKSSSEFLNVAAAPISHGLHGFYSSYLKRSIDVVGSLIGLILLSPFLAVIAVLIKSGSKGPLFFATSVVGEAGKTFEWYKFRTMRPGELDVRHREHVSEHIRLGSRPTPKLAEDTRITPIGRWLRRHSLDELPQLWNVVRGEMSLVGPRPCLPYEFQQYLDWHKERFIVRPGITGLWQVSGRSSVSFNDMVILDLYYIHNISLWLDTAIILRTIGVVLTGKGGG